MRIHILGICGTFMAGVAQLAHELGHEVSGSDSHVYPPMSDFLGATGIRVQTGWDRAALEPCPDLVIIGNALSRGNALVEAVLDAGLPYTSGAQWVAEQVLSQRRVIAVAGTHGKTTTASLLAWLLDRAGLDPGYLIGGMAQNFPTPARLGTGEYFVIEADEYDTAFFDKRSKFVHYRPRLALLNNLEFDHADIFPDLEAIKVQFHHLLRTVPRTGTVVWNSDEPALLEVIARGCWSAQLRFGATSGDWRVRALDGAYAIEDPAGQQHGLSGALPGRHNALNAAAALAVAALAGADLATCVAALASFTGVKRRMELLGTVAGISVYDDFAHHPTAIAATLEGLKQRAPQGRHIAVLELRSNSMRAGVHRDRLAGALAAADLCYLLAPATLTWDLGATVAALGARCRVRDNTAQIISELTHEARAGDQILLMSNGGFEQLPRRLLQTLHDRLAGAPQ
ncbi:MAG: UDP-N-acetylmuramate:L-alanyl-gamma-D-glutamyl-meso-diaminopimelate ligase [Gammaproteobacteria bacterium]|nr:UDP-N-acetylmuramate:L-alanyl-gamma-D-glutamyl-meso-diaminopimelate ligase [Gammaproteobacteria bacterium]